jgi:hypothetical protein
MNTQACPQQKRMIAGCITACALMPLVVAAFIQSRRPAPDTPQRCINLLLEAKLAGDVRAYMNCFTGELGKQLETDVERDGEGSFSARLKASVAALKGHAILNTEYSGTNRARVKLDLVYEARMWEFQWYELELDAGAWRVCAVGPVELHEPLVPYGTPAYPTSGDPAKASAR